MTPTDTTPLNWFGHRQSDFATVNQSVYVLNAHYQLAAAWWRARTPEERDRDYNAVVTPGYAKRRGFDCGWNLLSGGERENISTALVDARTWTAEEIERWAKAWPKTPEAA